MKVLFLMFVFPDMNTSFNMFTTLVEEFHLAGHDVFVLAPSNEKTAIRIEKNIPILRVKTLPIKNVSNITKGISNVLLPYHYKKALNKFYPNVKFDLIIAPTPPITLIDLAASLKKKHQAKFYLMLRDIFPQNAVDLGFMKKNGLIHNYFSKKEAKTYKTADYIGCMSQGNIKYLLDHNPSLVKEKLHELKNFQVLYSGYGKDHSHLKKQFDLENKFVVVFGGNMGKPQQLENVLKLAQSCQEYDDVLFLLLGEGVQMQNLDEKIKEQNIKNIRIQGTIPKQDYQDLLNICDVGLISLHQNFTIPNIPSKTLDYFNVGLPVLASIDKATDYDKVLEEAKAGLWSYAGDHKTLKNNFDVLYKNRQMLKEMGLNARNYFLKNLVPEIAFQTVLKNVTSK